MQLKYFRNLDGLRSIAAFAVIVAHFFTVERSQQFPVIAKIAALGNTGVSLFFVLSGFVITRILFNSVNSNNYFKSFYVRRTLRIFPLYYFGLLCYSFIPYFMGMAKGIAPFNEQVYYYTYLQNVARTFGWHASGPGHYWSLAVEEHFYLIWPAFIYLTYKAKDTRFFYIILIIMAMVLGLRYYMLSLQYDINIFTFTRLDQLALGGLLAVLERKGYLEKNNFSKYMIVLLAGLVGILLCYFMPPMWSELLKHNAFGLFYFGLIAVVIVSSQSALINRFLNLGFMQYLGLISYGIYVWHRLAIEIVDHYLSTNIIVDFLLVLAITIAVSAVSYKFLEKPFLRFKKYFAY